MESESDVPQHIAASAPRDRFGRIARLLHWLMAVLIVTMLFLGAALVGTIGNYGLLLSLHKTIGIAILVLAVLRLVNRVRRSALPRSSLRGVERFVAGGSEALMYLLFLAQPLVGWALVSASGAPIELFGGIYLPAIAPADAHLYAELRTLHSWLAYALLAVFTAHMCAVLAHASILRDGLLRRML
ncbi:cytochrome b [Nocardia jiangxiensis]|uniref:cytochrome b n=1 Tax=Nocardia jiangxiensis TaxID=282685 RepID=UPI000685EDA0|nr:cytochrome b [Nocardia jiangxiensis]